MLLLLLRLTIHHLSLPRVWGAFFEVPRGRLQAGSAFQLSKAGYSTPWNVSGARLFLRLVVEWLQGASPL